MHFDYGIIFRALPLAPEFAYAVERAGAIARRRKIVETASTLRNRSEHSVTVRDGLVPGNANHSAHRARRTDDGGRTIRLRIIRHEINITEILREVRGKRSDCRGENRSFTLRSDRSRLGFLLRARAPGGFCENFLRHLAEGHTELEHRCVRAASPAGCFPMRADKLYFGPCRQVEQERNFL